MLFLTYWELNEAMSFEQRQQIAKELTSSGLFPPEDVKIIRWDTTPDGWGMSLIEADEPEAVYRALNLWRAAGAGLFKQTRTAPALPVQEAMNLADGMLQHMHATTH
jgi:hypothetical protein